MKKKLYNAAYFLLNTSQSFEHSFGIRLQVIGLNVWIVGYALSRTYFGSLRAKAAIGDKF